MQKIMSFFILLILPQKNFLANQNHQRNAGGLYPADSSSAKREFGGPSNIFAGFQCIS